ncbi:DUF3575 domain-containing protein [Algibacter miyuki]|uniref:DUF3575 domain-containing protein n=1 Tax=Algibacter miyuki TaxID=1306933 RepID=A0ABV5GY63_9FLAO|nr:DUF3575 domain-containing protein [Algibacter miyuki]MDN3667217.1 DUF3575 domain-containing protein [Algibacter miyuki]
MRKIITLAILMSLPLFSSGQVSIKGNMLTALVAVPNFGVETHLGTHTTFQFDAAASFWTKDGAPIKFIMVFPEFRYYTRESGSGFFVGAHIGGAKYKLQKPQYFDTDYYQDGYSVFYGMTLGYQFELNDRFNLELFLGGGNQQGYYKGLSLETGERVESAEKFNKSGEWLPYRGGLMLVYKLK